MYVRNIPLRVLFDSTEGRGVSKHWIPLFAQGDPQNGRFDLNAPHGDDPQLELTVRFGGMGEL